MTYRVRNISKSFPGVRALHDVSISFERGDIHAVCGENGAGKSTLMKILSGNLLPDRGELFWNDQKITLNSPTVALTNGIAIVHQHLSLSENMTVAENIFINRQPRNKLGFIDFQQLHQKTNALLNTLRIAVKPGQIVSKLKPGEKQQVEIAKAISMNPAFLILDEPTASLSEKQASNLFMILRRMAVQGVGIIYISHRIAEIFKITNKVSVLKDGTYQGTWPTSAMTRQELIRRMVGREILNVADTTSAREEVLLEVQDLSGKGFNDINFKIRKGEIVGLSGLAGAGRTEIARSLFGIDRSTGKILLRGNTARINHPSSAIRHGIAYVPEERRSLGLFPQFTIRDNIASSQLAFAHPIKYDRDRFTAMAEMMKEQLRIACTSVLQKVASLSGGNQQKVLLAKWLLLNPKVLIIDEPTHGVDVGAKYEIYSILKALAAEEKGILLISSELPEVLTLCDRIIVLKQGRIAGELSKAEATEEKIMDLAT